MNKPIETAHINCTIHFLLNHQVSMIECVVHLIEKVCSVESAGMALQFHLSVGTRTLFQNFFRNNRCMHKSENNR